MIMVIMMKIMEVEKELEMKRMVNKTKEQTLCEAGTQTLEVWIIPILIFCLIIMILSLQSLS